MKIESHGADGSRNGKESREHEDGEKPGANLPSPVFFQGSEMLCLLFGNIVRNEHTAGVGPAESVKIRRAASCSSGAVS